MRRRVRVEIRGAVQGVGFRPFVYRLAQELDLAGCVVNDTRGVVVEVEGTAESLRRFMERLPDEKPRPAVIQSLADLLFDGQLRLQARAVAALTPLVLAIVRLSAPALLRDFAELALHSVHLRLELADLQRQPVLSVFTAERRQLPYVPGKLLMQPLVFFVDLD